MNANISIHHTMSISGQNLSIVIVTLKSEQVIHRCFKSINQNVPIIVVENSDNEKFKNDLETKYKNVQCVQLSKINDDKRRKMTNTGCFKSCVQTINIHHF